MTEYVIIICIVAIAVLLVIGVFGTNIRNLFATANQSMSQGQAKEIPMQSQGGGTDRINNFSDQ